MLNRQLSPAQIAIASGLFFTAVALLVFAAFRSHVRTSTAPRPVEMAPVSETVTAGPREESAQAPQAMSAEQARRQELLQSTKYNLERAH